MLIIFLCLGIGIAMWLVLAVPRILYCVLEFWSRIPGFLNSEKFEIIAVEHDRVLHLPKLRGIPPSFLHTEEDATSKILQHVPASSKNKVCFLHLLCVGEVYITCEPLPYMAAHQRLKQLVVCLLGLQKQGVDKNLTSHCLWLMGCAQFGGS